MKLESDCLSKQKFIDGKVSKIRFLLNKEESANRFVTGFQDSPCNMITCWEIESINNLKDEEKIKRIGNLKTAGDVNDLVVVSEDNIIAGLSNGTLNFIKINENGQMNITNITPQLNGAITSICAMNSDEVYFGTNTGHIFKNLHGYSNASIKFDLFGSNLMGVSSLSKCGSNLFVSGHSTGQIHLWDIRSKGVSFTLPELAHHIPSLSRAASTLNDSITAITSHPAEPNVVAYGTNSGSICFVDIRNVDETLPNLIKIRQDTINDLKFNPSYPNNFFSSSYSSLIHWDATSLCVEESWKNYEEVNFLDEKPTLNFNALSKKRKMQFRTNIWLSSKVWDTIQLKALLEENPKYISSFDVSRDTIIVGSNTSDIVVLQNI